jgi:hypothetical protein
MAAPTCGFGLCSRIPTTSPHAAGTATLSLTSNGGRDTRVEFVLPVHVQRVVVSGERPQRIQRAAKRGNSHAHSLLSLIINRGVGWLMTFVGPGILDADAGLAQCDGHAWVVELADAGAREERPSLGLGEPESRTVADRSQEGGSAPAGLQGHGAVAPGWSVLTTPGRS